LRHPFRPILVLGLGAAPASDDDVFVIPDGLKKHLLRGSGQESGDGSDGEA